MPFLHRAAAAFAFTLLAAPSPVLAQQQPATPSFTSCGPGGDAQLCALAKACTAEPAGKTCHDGLMAEAYLSAQWLIENAASKALGQVAVRFGARTDDLGRMVRDYEAAATKVRTLESGLIESYSKPDRSGQDALQAQLAAARADTARLDERLRAAQFGDYQEMSRPRPLPLSETQALLQSDEAMLVYMVGRTSSFVWVITRTSADWKVIEATEEELADKILALRRGLDPDPGCTRGPLTGRRTAVGGPTFDFALSNELYRTLVAPVAPSLAPAKKVIIAPSGALMSLPFAVLTSSPPPTGQPQIADYRNASWFGLDKALAVLPAPSSLRALRCASRNAAGQCAPRTGRPAPAQRMIGFGNPLLHSPGAPAVVAGPEPATRSGCSGSKDAYQGDALSQDALGRLDELPNSERELKDIAASIKGSSQIFLGAEATEARLKSTPLSANLIVFATHGLIANEISGIEEAGLVFSRPALQSPARAPDLIDNGYLTVSEAAELRIVADWVVLSACNTALGEHAGSQGLSGLARAFFFAGADSLLVSHWPVYDDAAAALTAATVSRAESTPGISRAEALRLTMRAIVTNPEETQLRRVHPSYWAPFVFVGL